MPVQATQETRVGSLSWEEPLEQEKATHSSTLVWKISCKEEPGRLQSMESQKIRHNWTLTHVHILRLNQGEIKKIRTKHTKILRCKVLLFWNIKLFSLTLFLNLSTWLIVIWCNTIPCLNTLLLSNNIMTYIKIISQNLIFLSLEAIKIKLKLG